MIKFKLHTILEEKGQTMYWLSKETGIRPNTISQWVNDSSADAEKKVKQISVDTLEKMCAALECNVSDLIEYVND